MMKDDYAIVLDFLARGKPGDRKAEPVAQVLGEKFFSLLEIVIKEGIFVKPRDKIYIGDQSREQVEYIRGRINFSDLTSYAKTELEGVLEEIVTKDEKRFIEFFNKAGPITTRLHSLELLPGIGKKHMWDVINARKKKPFESFADLQQRVEMLPDPKRILIKRMLDEFEEKDRYRLIVGSGIF
jgi:putative nucleotide binding protein